MAYFQRIALFLLFCVPMFISGTAHADYPKTLQHYLLNGWGYTNISNQEVCTYFVNAKKSAYPSEGITQSTCNEAQVVASGWSGGPTSYSNAISKYGTCSGVSSLWGDGICTGSCTAPYTMQNGVCAPPPTCTPPLVLDSATNTCKDPCEPKAGQQESYFSAVASGGDSCVGGCTVAMSGGECGQNATGQTGCFYQGTYTGASCDGSESGTGNAADYDAPDTPEYDCIKSGQSWGTVNGQVVCVGKGTSGSSPTKSYSEGTKTTTKNADGTETTTQDPPKVVSTNTGADGNTKITETTTNSDGTITTKEADVKTYCEANPDAAVCKEADKGSFTGDCSSGFMCNGDAAQCALAREVHQRNCEFFKPDAEMSDAFTGMKSTEQTASNLIPRETINIVNSLDASSSIGATCPPDKVVQVMNQTVTFPISQLCGTLEALGYIFLALSYIAAARIIGGAV
jgi:hypothetical protein